MQPGAGEPCIAFGPRAEDEAESPHGDQDERRDGDRRGGPRTEEAHGDLQVRARDAPRRLRQDGRVLGPHDEVARVGDEQDTAGQEDRDVQLPSGAARSAPDHARDADEAEAGQHGDGHVDGHETLQDDQQQENGRPAAARHGCGGEIHDEGEVLEDGIVEGRGRPGPEHPAGGEKGPGGDEPGQVRGGPAAHHDVEGARRERERDEERQVGSERGVPGQEERRHEVGQGAEAGVAVEEGVASGIVDVRVGEFPRCGDERVALMGQCPDHLEEIELALERAVREVRAQVGREGPGEPDHDRSVEWEG